MTAIGIGLVPELRRAAPQSLDHEAPSAPQLPSNWRGAVTFSADVQGEYDTFAGAPADFLWMTTPHTSWAAFDTGFDESLTEFAGDARPVVWSLPLSVDGTSLAEIAGGSNDANFLSAAETMLAAAPDDNGAIIIRLGWEANYTGLWAWTAVGVETDYIAAWRRVHGLLREVSNRFMFDWCLNYVNEPTDFDPETIYPGDAYVDIVSTDLYYRPIYGSGPESLPTNPDPVGNFHYVKETLPYGLDWIAAFAAAHEKPMAVPEWGVGWDKPQWVELAANWIKSIDPVYQTYFDNNVDPTHQTRISDGSKGLAGHAYLMHFGSEVPVFGGSAITGAVPGELGSGGVMPTGWGQNLSNVTVTVLGTDIVDGVACLRVRVAANGTGGDFSRFASFLAPIDWPGAGPAAQGEHWRMAAAIRMEEATGPGAVLFSAELNEVNSGGGWLGNDGTYSDPGYFAGFPFYADQHVYMRKLSNAGVATVTGVIGVFLDASTVPSSADVLIAAPVLMREPTSA